MWKWNFLKLTFEFLTYLERMNMLVGIETMETNWIVDGSNDLIS